MPKLELPLMKLGKLKIRYKIRIVWMCVIVVSYTKIYIVNKDFIDKFLEILFVLLIVSRNFLTSYKL